MPRGRKSARNRYYRLIFNIFITDIFETYLFQQFVIDPEMAAKRKITKQQRKKEAKKRKMDVMKGKKVYKKRKQTDIDFDE